MVPPFMLRAAIVRQRRELTAASAAVNAKNAGPVQP